MNHNLISQKWEFWTKLCYDNTAMYFSSFLKSGISQCKDVSHWLGLHLDWSLQTLYSYALPVACFVSRHDWLAECRALIWKSSTRAIVDRLSQMAVNADPSFKLPALKVKWHCTKYPPANVFSSMHLRYLSQIKGVWIDSDVSGVYKLHILLLKYAIVSFVHLYFKSHLSVHL